MTSPSTPDTSASAQGPTLLLENLSWPEVDALRGDIEVVLIPVGSNEQHGPNLTVNYDIAHSAAICRELSRQMYPRVLVAPAIPWGVSHHHMNFPGTITLSTSTFIQVLLEVVASLQHHGFERFLIVNGHGGNREPLGVAVVDIQEALEPTFIGALSPWSFHDPAAHEKHGKTAYAGHACEIETSIGLHLMPETVKQDALEVGGMTELATGFGSLLSKYSVSVAYRFDRLTTNGALGDATISTVEYGRDLVESTLSGMASFIEELILNAPIPDFADDDDGDDLLSDE